MNILRRRNKMELLLRRIALKDNYTIGHLYLIKPGESIYLCDTIEDPVRDLNHNGKFDNGEHKVYGKTAIPYGTYIITMNVRSEKYRNYAKYPFAKPYGAYMPRLLNVPDFDGILIHPGTTADDSLGCILVGQNKEVGKVINSQATWKRLMDRYFMPAKSRPEKITITIK